MQVSVEKSGALERRVSVEVPEDQIESEVLVRLKKLTQTVRIDGFRPGKAPLKVIRQRFGGRVRDEVVGDVLRSSLTEAMTNEDLKPVGQPVIDPIAAAPGQGLSYTATFEVYPEIELAPVETIEMDRPICEITESDVDKMVDTLREQNKTWREVERPSMEGDQVTIDYEGTVDGKVFDGGTAADFELVLGAGIMIEGFEDGLQGCSKGDDITLDLQFPEGYRNADLAGKPARFAVQVKNVSEGVPAELNDEFFDKFGVSEGGLEAFRAEIRGNMDRERDQALKKRFNSHVLEKLEAANEVQVPRALIDNEVARIQQQTRSAMMMRGMNPDELGLPGAEVIEPQARKRVKLGLIMAEMIKQAEIRADPAKVRAAIERMAASYEDPAAVVKWHYEDPQRLQEVEAMCLEDAAVNWIADRAKVGEAAVSFDDLMNPGQTEQNADSD
jgi:trigger factor